MTVIEDELKEYRLSKAKEIELPAYCVFDDKTLLDLCDKLPTKKEHFVFIKGFKEIDTPRTEKYADEIVNIINHYLKTYNLKSPLEEFLLSYKKTIINFINQYNGTFSRKEIFNLITKCSENYIYTPDND